MEKTEESGKDKKYKIGDLLVDEGYITSKQLGEALDAQNDVSVYTPLGEILIGLRHLNRQDLRKILRAHHKRIFIGELLINMGLVTKEHMIEALSAQKTTHKKVGETLVGMGFLSETELVNTLSLQLGIPKITPDMNLIDKSLLDGLSQPFLFKNEFLPAFRDGNTLTVIMADPLDEHTLHTLRTFFKCHIEPAVATRNEILSTIGMHFNKIELGPGKEASYTDEIKDLVIGGRDLSSIAGDSTVEIVNFIISNAISEGASDIHIEPHETSLRIRYRIDGILIHMTDLPRSITNSLISRIKVLCGLDISEKRRHQDGRIEARVLGKEIDLRVSTYAAMWGENIVIRILHRQSTLIDVDELGFSPVNIARYKKLIEYPSGIILATGPTGSGKTTTLYASLQYLNGMDKMIITVEDPVEYTIDGVVQGKIDHKLGLTYMDFLKSMMRQDPDVLMIGEIRDHVAAEAAIQAALTGHKVFSTFHTDDTTGALLRLMDMGIDTFLISSTVVSVISQRLVRTLCSHCKEAYTPGEDIFSSFSVHSIDIKKHKFFKPKGCQRCNQTGFKGRTAIHELLVVNDAIRDAILARQPSSHIRVIARERAGLISMRDDGFYKAAKGITSLEEIVRVVFYNEGDDMTSRSAEELIAMCNMTKEMFTDTGLPKSGDEVKRIKDSDASGGKKKLD